MTKKEVNPSIKNGNFPMANELAEQFARVNITGQEWRIIWVVWRKTWGWIDQNNLKRRKDWDWISLTQFEKYTGMKRANICRILKKLVANKLLLKRGKEYKFNQNYNAWVVAKRLQGVARRITGSSLEHNLGGSLQATHKRNSYKRNYTKETLATDVASNEAIKVIITVFRKINPLLAYNNKTQRNAAKALIDELGSDVAVEVADIAVKVQGKKYAPTITTPLQLKAKFGSLKVYVKKNTTSPVMKIS